MYYVYILKSSLNQRYYVGHTDNLEKRLKQHNAGKTPSTKPYRPWTVVYSETFPDKTSAYLREMKIKSMKSRSYIESLINQKG